MDTTTLLFLASTLACPIAIGGLMWLMMKQMQQDPEQPARTEQPPVSAAERLAVLQAQQVALETEIASARKLAARETQTDNSAAHPSTRGKLDVAPTSKL